MDNLSDIGRKFYGISIAGLGSLTIYYSDFPYMLIPPKHSWILDLAVVSYIFGVMFILAGTCIVFKKEIRIMSLILASLLLIIFCLYFIPYQLIVSSKFMQLGDWENAEKELALSGGAFVIAGCFSEKNQTILSRLLSKLIPSGTIFFALAIISFGIDHFLYAKEAADYVPSWIPNHMFWIYFAGIPLVGSGLAIMLKIKVRIIAALLGAMIFIWFIILHIPYVIAAHFSDTGGEVTSAFLALGYSGIAFVISGAAKKNSRKYSIKSKSV